MFSPLSSHRRRRRLLSLMSSAVLAAGLPRLALPAAEATAPALGSTAPDGVFPRTVRHWAGSTTIEQAPKRVAVLSTGQADGLLTLGVVPAGATRDDRGALISDYLLQAYPEHKAALSQVMDLGTRQSADVEAVAALQPDLILVNRAATPPAILAQYRRIAPTVVTRGTGFHWRADFVLLADALGRREAAERWLQDFVQRGQAFGRWFAAHDTSHTSHTVPGAGISFVQAGGGRIRLMGQQSFIGDITKDMMLPRPPSQQFGRTSQDIGIERIDMADGAWVFYAARGDGVKVFLDSPLWKYLHAVQANQAVRVDYDAFYMNAGPTAARTVMDTLTQVLAPGGFSGERP